MKIEKLLPPPAPGRAWMVQLEDGTLLRLNEGVVADFALYQGKELDEQTLESLRSAAFLGSLREKTVSMLTSRLLSAGQVKEKLLAKGATEEQAQEIIDWAENIGLINDEEYAKALVRHYQTKGYGIYQIKDELYRRRVPRDLWDRALEELTGPEQAIDTFLAAKLRDPFDPKQVKKASDALLRRGFSWSQAAEGIERARNRRQDETDWEVD